MVINGQTRSGIVTLAFAGPTESAFEFEATEIADIVKRVGEQPFYRPHRLTFFQVLLLRSGSAKEEIDFVQHDLGPGMVSFVRPGQVQRLWMPEPCEGRLLLFEPSFISTGEENAEVLRIAPVTESSAAIENTFDSLFLEYSQIATQRLSRGIIFHELLALLLRLERQSESAPSSAAYPSEVLDLFRRFEGSMEANFGEQRSVAALARHLGCGEKRLSRACLAVSGMAPKRLIQNRVALEAKRILAHTDVPVNEISSRLGFSESTNFAKFFHRTTGELPKAFRVRVQSGRYAQE